MPDYFFSYITPDDYNWLHHDDNTITDDSEEERKVTVRCYCCERELEDGEGVEFSSRRRGTVTLCPECHERYVSHCPHCGKEVFTCDSYTYWIENDRYDFCSSTCRDKHMQELGYERCNSCDGYYREFVEYSDARHETPMHVCSGCFESRVGENYVRSYDYVPDYPVYLEPGGTQRGGSFYNGAFEKPGETYVGIEQELEGGYKYRFMYELNKALRDEGKGNLLYFMHDGSLTCGIEVTSCVVNYESMLNGDYPLDLIESTAKEYGMKAKWTCGFHVHVNRKSLGDEEAERDLTAAKVVLLFDKFYDNLREASNRDRSQAEHYAQKPNAYIEPSDAPDVACDKARDKCMNHYACVNLRPRNTMEFRLWGGTRDAETVKRLVDLTVAITRVARDLSLADVAGLSWERFMEELSHHVKYKPTMQMF